VGFRDLDEQHCGKKKGNHFFSAVVEEYRKEREKRKSICAVMLA
jgi:hypothetical protein